MLMELFQASTGDGAIHITLGTGIAALIVKDFYQAWIASREKKNGNGNCNSTKCGVDNMDYWDRMENRVTKPIVDAIDRIDRLR